MADLSQEPPQQEHENHQQQQTVMEECMHKTKTVQFLGRTTPIILQNENGPCPLLAVCNILLLRNNLNLSPDTGEVSQEKLLSLVAERLIDSNSNVNMQNKDVGYLENQQQNIADAIDLLPRLATGIDVNIKFRRIDDFEFTPECAIFDLLDIPLYHGWIVDPQDQETANAIGSKSYNALMGELVALETIRGECKNSTEEDCVDFAAATTAALGVPSPSLSKTRSFEDSPRSLSDQEIQRKGDFEEERELLKALKLSETEVATSQGDFLGDDVNDVTTFIKSDESTSLSQALPLDHVNSLQGQVCIRKQSAGQPEYSTFDNPSAPSNDDIKNQASFESFGPEEACIPSSMDVDIKPDQSSAVASGEHVLCDDVVKKKCQESLVQVQDVVSLSPVKDTSSKVETNVDISPVGEEIGNQFHSATDVHQPADGPICLGITESRCLSVPHADSDSSSGRIQQSDVPETFTSSVDGSEPIYEGEECILDSGTSYKEREPIYEGEVILAEQAENSTTESYKERSKDGISTKEGELIKNFLKNSASQLTFYGLFCLQDGLRERELCVFFRNNHFNTMFKFEGELYLLATDQGYINEPDLVWEKLNEVNGDTLFMTGNFKEFKVESHANETWDEHGAMSNTADYLARIKDATKAGFDENSDLQLAIALQQQEFEQQPERPNIQQPSVSSGSRLVTGPQVSRHGGRNNPTSSSYSRPEAKAKEKCSIM